MGTITDHDLLKVAETWEKEQPINIGVKTAFAAGYRIAESKTLHRLSAARPLPIAVSSILDEHLPADGKIGGEREALRMKVHYDIMRLLVDFVKWYDQLDPFTQGYYTKAELRSAAFLESTTRL
jgi:hypothetical protein